MDQLRAIFPDLDASTLEATLAAHGGNVERTVNYLLTAQRPGGNARDAARVAQEAADAELARRLQAEDMAAARGAYNNDSDVGGSGGGGSGRLWGREGNGGRGGGGRDPDMRRGSADSSVFGLPSLADMQSAVQPLVSGVAHAGRVAANSVSELYRELVGEDDPRRHTATTGRPESARDESVVLRGEGSSPNATRSTARQRRSDASTIGRSHGDKKDD